MTANQEDDIFLNAIASAKKHNIKLKPGVHNEASGNCSYEAVIHNINYRDCFQEKLPFSFDYYRRIWTTDMMNRTLDASSHWNPGLTKKEITKGFQDMMISGVYERPFFGDMMMAGIACGIRRRILIFNTNINIIKTGHDPIAVVDPNDFGGQVIDDYPVVVAYNLVHYESLHPEDQEDLEETVKLTKSYIANPCRYFEEYGFTRFDIVALISPEEVTNNEQCKSAHLETTKNKVCNFLFLGDDFTEFKEMSDGFVQCGVCGKSFSRIFSHLKQSPNCGRKVDVAEFKSKWEKHQKRKRNERYIQRQKVDNEEKFIKSKVINQKKYEKKQKEENKVSFLQKKVQSQRKCDEKQKKEDKERFLKKKVQRQMKCYDKQKKEDKESFLKKKVQRQMKCNEKQKKKTKKTS